MFAAFLAARTASLRFKGKTVLRAAMVADALDRLGLFHSLTSVSIDTPVCAE